MTHNSESPQQQRTITTVPENQILLFLVGHNRTHNRRTKIL